MLSIIIPTLNEEDYLPLLLKEIKKQTCPSFASQNLSGQDSSDYEIIVADANSEDKTVEIAKSFGCKITKGGLPAKGRNEGAKLARGDIFLFMDADNVYLPENFLKNLLSEFKKRNLGVAAFPIYPVSSPAPQSGAGSNGVYLKGTWVDRFIYGIYNRFVKLTQNFSALAFNSILVKKEVHQKIGGFDEEIKIAEDLDYARRAAKISKFGFIETEPILTSCRRYERDGRFKTYFKYLLIGLWILFFGPVKSDIFKYKFGHYEKKNRSFPSW